VRKRLKAIMQNRLASKIFAKFQKKYFKVKGGGGNGKI
jgi:hypothetical protein